MSKYRLLLVVMFGVCTGQLMSMGKIEEGKKNGRLNFTIEHRVLDNSFIITASSAQDLDYYVEPKEFLGKDMLSLLPLSADDRKKLIQGFRAASGNQTVRVSYTLDQKQYVAKIVPLFAPKDDENPSSDNSDVKWSFFVRVKEQAN